MKLESERIVLRPITEEDTEDIIKWRNSENVMRHFIIQTPLTKEIHERWLQEKVASGQVVQFVIIEKLEGKPIGSVYFRDICEKSAEFGIFIGEESYLGKGYGNEAQHLAMDYAFNELDLKKVVLRVLSDNIGAITIYEKNGFRQILNKNETVVINGENKTILFMEAVNEKA